MEVKVIEPYGYCAGVLLAIKIALEAKARYEGKRIYLVGMLVHNEESVEMLSKKGFSLIDERKTDLREALLSLQEGDVVIFSAHGHPYDYDELAKNKGLIAIDATCRFVKENVMDAKNALEKGDEILYLGSKGHLETTGFLANLPEASFFDVKSMKLLKNLCHGNSPLVFSQTTLSEIEIEESLTLLRASFPNLRTASLRCHSTQLRQSRIAALDESVETVIVLGSKTSNNSMKLFEIAKENGKEAYICLNLNEVKALDLSKHKKIALASGASTSRETFEEVREYLLSL